MKKFSLVISFISVTGFGLLTVGAGRAAAQGPAGAGASGSTQQSSDGSSGHSLNPIKWIKKDKDSKSSTDSSSRSDLEKKLTPKLQAAGLLPANSTATDACAPFNALNECLAALHASHNLGVDFICLRANVTGVIVNADLSGCKGAVGDKAQSLNKAIHELNPNADAKGAAKNAEQQAKDDLKDLAS